MFGLMTRRQFMREITEARKAYRWERDDALASAAESERKHRQLLDALFPNAYVQENHFAPNRRMRFVVEIDEKAFNTPLRTPDWEHIARKIITDLRGAIGRERDMREVMPQGIGGPELPSRSLL